MKPNLIRIDAYQKRPELKSIDFQQWVDQADKNRKVDVKSIPCDEKLLRIFDLLTCCKIGAVPWQRMGSDFVFLYENESAKQKIRAAFSDQNACIVFSLASKADIDSELRRMGGDALLENAHKTCPDKDSVRSLPLSNARTIATIAILSIAVSLYFVPMIFMIGITLFASFFILGNSALRMCALLNISKHETAFVAHQSLYTNPPPKGWPSVTILIPLFRESEVLHSLLDNLISMDYPKSKLDIKLLIENDDDMTSDALSEIDLPPHFDVVRVPEDTLRTKPKAMNYALPFCRSQILGIYDAEDKPDIMQLRKVAHTFASAPQDAACVQCELDFFNARQNWFTRCFTIEYRIWFAAVLPVVQKLGLAVPLGGTSLFIKREILEQVGAWDAHNVTEDADLGIRLKRHGYETLVLRSRTMEEANSRGISWVRQRSRWLKGYMMTWLCHMRDPISLLRELGFLGFVGFHIMFLGAIVNYLSLPLFWVMWLSVFGMDPFYVSQTPLFFQSLFFSIMLFAQVINFSLAFMALRKNDNTKDLFLWYLTMPFYWPLGAAAAYKAMIEVVVAPYYWDKTQHGHAKKKVTSDKKTA